MNNMKSYIASFFTWQAITQNVVQIFSEGKQDVFILPRHKKSVRFTQKVTSHFETKTHKRLNILLGLRDSGKA